MEEMQFTTQRLFSLRCFKCGQVGHTNKNDGCKNEKSVEGDEAWIAYKNWKRSDAKDYVPIVLERDYSKIFKRWMDAEPTDVVQDVMHVVKKRNSKNAFHDFTCAYRIYFSERLKGISETLDAMAADVVDQKTAVAQLNIDLNNAVKEGKPPSFTDKDANVVYCRDRLPTRVRYMYAAILNDLVVSNYVREMFLPSLKPEEKSTIHVASVGSGPGNDFVAFVLLRDFLKISQNDHVQTIQHNKTIKCVNYDLFSSDWSPIVQVVKSSLGIREGGNNYEKGGGREDRNWGDQVLEQQMDLRKPLSDSENTHINVHIENFDLFAFTFVLHENRAYCEKRNEKGEQVGVSNALLGILEGAKIGAVIIGLDAGNRLLQIMFSASKALGWEGEIPKSKWKMGCKSTILLVRRSHPNE